MKFVTFLQNGQEKLGGLKSGNANKVVDISDKFSSLHQVLKDDATAQAIAAIETGNAVLSLDSLELLPPITTAEKYFCIGVNYANRNAEYKEKFNVTQGKNFERSGALGPWMVPLTDDIDLTDLKIQTRVNGELRQDDHTSNMMFPIEFQIEYLSKFARLKAGDIIATGTPNGAGARFDPPKYLVPGDVVEVTCPGIGSLSNEVRDEVV